MSDSPGDDSIKETDIYRENERSSLDPSAISDDIIEIVDNLDTENDVTNDNLKYMMLMVCHIRSNCLLQVLNLVGSLFITDTEVWVDSSNELECEFPEFIESLNNCEDNTLHLDENEALIWCTIGFIAALENVCSLPSKAIG